MNKHLQSDKVFRMPSGKIVRPVDGETEFNQLGLSAGFIHFACPTTGINTGFCGTNWFDENAVEQEDW